MRAAAAGVNLSDVSNEPTETIRRPLRSPTRSLRLNRPGGEEDLVLTTVSRAAQVDEAMTATMKIVVALMGQPRIAALVPEVLPMAFPWLKAADSPDNPAPMAQVIVGWRHTAGIYADPELLAALTQDGADFGPVPEPPACASKRNDPVAPPTIGIGHPKATD